MSNLSPVLVAEDNPNDVFLVRRAFQENNTANPVHAVGNGDEAIKYLAGEGQYADRAAYPFSLLFLGEDFALDFDQAVTIIVGENEVKENRFTVKNLQTGEQASATQVEILDELRARKF